MSDLHGLLEAIRARYAHAARMANDLRERLDAIENERAHWEAAAAQPDVEARARLELKEIDHLRPRMERSAWSWGDRARALELIVAAALMEAPPSRVAPEPVAPPVEDYRPLLPPAPAPVAWPDGGPARRSTAEAPDGSVQDTSSPGHLWER
jgi:hypothetical protein